MLPLSPKTEVLFNAAFGDKSDAYRARVRKMLEDEIGQSIPFCESANSEDMQRIRFAVIRLLYERGMKESDVLNLARTDWRDLLMAAGFGYDVRAHLLWYYDVTGSNARD